MKNKANREFKFDNRLNIEAYSFSGIYSTFPMHFHNFYVIGYIEKGKRNLICNNEERTIQKGDILVFNPQDCHECRQIDDAKLIYKALNIPIQTFISISNRPVRFLEHVIENGELYNSLSLLHKIIVTNSLDFNRWTLLNNIIHTLINHCKIDFIEPIKPFQSETSDIFEYINKNFSKKLTLNDLCEYAKMSKSTFLRKFIAQKGITPYKYLQNYRINRALDLIKQGIPIIEASINSGFNDQSHFTNIFRLYTGLVPSMYKKLRG